MVDVNAPFHRYHKTIMTEQKVLFGVDKIFVDDKKFGTDSARQKRTRMCIT